jgi:hypothetical protein
MEHRKKSYWKICVILTILLTVTGFSPLILPGGVYKPMIMGIPYTLFASFLVTVALVTLTYIGARVHPGKDEEEAGL